MALIFSAGNQALTGLAKQPVAVQRNPAVKEIAHWPRNGVARIHQGKGPAQMMHGFQQRGGFGMQLAIQNDEHGGVMRRRHAVMP